MCPVLIRKLLIFRYCVPSFRLLAQNAQFVLSTTRSSLTITQKSHLKVSFDSSEMLSIKASISALKFTSLLKQSISKAAKIVSRSSPHKIFPYTSHFLKIYALIDRPPQFPKLATATVRVSRLIFFLVTMFIIIIKAVST